MYFIVFFVFITFSHFLWPYLCDKTVALSLNLSSYQIILATANTQGIKIGVQGCKFETTLKPDINGKNYWSHSRHIIVVQW